MVSERLSKNGPVILMLLINLSVIFYYTEYQESFKTIVWIYYFQSIFLGLYTLIINMRNKNYNMRGMTMNGKPVENNAKGKRSIGCFFALHYGGFHLVLGIMLLVFLTGKPGVVDFRFVLLFITVLFFHYVIKGLVFKPKEGKESRLIGTMALPYLRLLPLFALIFFSSRTDFYTITMGFLIIKTIVDLLTMKIGERIGV